MQELNKSESANGATIFFMGVVCFSLAKLHSKIDLIKKMTQGYVH